VADALVGSALSVAAFAAIVLGPLWASTLLVGRFCPDLPLPVRWTATGTVWLGGIVTAFLLLSTLHLFRVPAAAFLGAALAIGAQAAWGSGSRWTRDGEVVRSWLRWAVDSRIALILAVVALASVIAGVRAVQMPPLAWDSLTYHLVLAAKWVQAGARIGFPAPDGMDGYGHFPFNGEALAAWLLLPFHGDELVNLLNFPFLFLLVLGLYALSRELGTGRATAVLISCCVGLAPMFFAYLTTAYVDPQVSAELVIAALFFFRYERTRDFRDALLLFTALGLAVGTKLTAVWSTALLTGILFWWTWRSRRGRFVLVAGLALLLLLGGTQYVKNLLETGNPVYPMGVSVAGHEILSGSLYVERSVKEKGPGSWLLDLGNLQTLFLVEPPSYPRSAGPLFLGFVLLALSMLVAPPPGLSRARRWLLLLLWLAPLLAFYFDRAPNSVAARRFWPVDTPRFLAAPLALAAVAAGLQIDRWKARISPGPIVLAGAILASVFSLNFRVLDPGSALWIALALVALPGLLLWAWYRSRELRPVFRSALLLAILPLAVLALANLRPLRDGLRWPAYAAYTDLHDIKRGFVEGWKWCDDPDHPQRIALTTGWGYAGHNWFFYPLLGRRLQNDVVYVSINRRDEPPTSADRGLLRETANFDVWVENLRRKKVDLIFAQRPAPIELRWMRAHPELFEPVKQGVEYWIYRFRSGRP
jgi:4-amino-4-deoxy-L-arabinose transferase-like glycosyltransferase